MKEYEKANNVNFRQLKMVIVADINAIFNILYF